MLNFNIRYVDDLVPRLQRFKGNCYDVTAEGISVNGVPCYDTVTEYKAGDVLFIKFGFAIDMTDTVTGIKYVGDVKPRSSTFKNYGLILTNSVGMIDNEYNGDDDSWCGMFYAVKDGSITIHDRIAQIEFRKEAEHVLFTSVDTLNNNSRGGYGSTGK